MLCSTATSRLLIYYYYSNIFLSYITYWVHCGNAWADIGQFSVVNLGHKWLIYCCLGSYRHIPKMLKKLLKRISHHKWSSSNFASPPNKCDSETSTVMFTDKLTWTNKQTVSKPWFKEPVFFRLLQVCAIAQNKL